MFVWCFKAALGSLAVEGVGTGYQSLDASLG